MDNTVQSFYGNKLRVRACGILIKENKLLLVNHSGISKKDFWSPPGGGIEFNESAFDCLKREFMEEVGLRIEIKDFLFACEFIHQPMHAIELFFLVSASSDQVVIGEDPEPDGPKIIRDVKFLSWYNILAISPDELHGIFKHLKHPTEITALRGYFKV